ncbi:hypothetical protein GCM10020331_009360 [Ectobacillus funiculus]
MVWKPEEESLQSVFILKIQGTEDIIVSVQDDGTGINEETLEEINSLLKSDPIARRDSGFGLINVHARIFDVVW